MRETVAFEPLMTVAATAPASILDHFRSFEQSVAERTLLAWGEHCTECSFPACYSSCSFYTPRADFHCRRFENGIETAPLPDLAFPLMRIKFRKWGKLESAGPQRLVTARDAVRREEFVTNLDGALAAMPAPSRLKRHLARRLNDYKSRGTDAANELKDTYFVIECYSAGPQAIPFTVTFLPKSKSDEGLYQERVLLGAGYRRAVIAADKIAAVVDLARPFLVQIEPLIEAPEDHFEFGIVDFVRLKSGLPAAFPLPAAAPSQKSPAAKAKCIVWDLDNTVWDGTLAEDGVGGLQLREDIVEIIKTLDARGILHSCASKNDEAEGLAALKHFGLEEYFLFPHIGWGPKSQSVHAIRELLDIGIDTFAFVDDQPFERGEVADAHGAIRVFSDAEARGFLSNPIFDVPVTAESGKRRFLYMDEMRRRTEFKSSGSNDYDSFLRKCEIRLEINDLTDGDVTRIHELSQRTNQLNISGARYDRAAVEAMLRGGMGKRAFVLRTIDRYGDYGIIGFLVMTPASGLIEDYFMSCRVQRKRVEHALFQYLTDLASAHGALDLKVRYRRTERNALSLDLLAGLGFALEESEPGRGQLVRRLEPIAGSDIVRIVAPPSGGRAAAE